MSSSKDASSDARSLSEQTESAGSLSSSTASVSTSRRTSATPQPQPPTQPQPIPTAKPVFRTSSSSSLARRASPLPGTSPRTSRQTSPIRKDKVSPLNNNGSSGPPSAAAIQRALSSSNMPQLAHGQNTSENLSKLPRKQDKAAAAASDASQPWPTSPRITSPPPATPHSRRNNANSAQKRSDSAPVGGTAAASASAPATPATPASKQPETEPTKTDAKTSTAGAGKTPLRATAGKSLLETVQETSSDTIVEPSPAVVKVSQDLKPLTPIGEEDRKSRVGESDKHPSESGNESTGNKSDGARGRRPSSTAPAHVTQKPSRPNVKPAYPLSSTKVRPAEGKQNMTVETETVQSIPQSGLTAGDRSLGLRNEAGSVRLKPSTETIRPRKERKKVDRKARSINQGTATSKADLFEARVASAVDEVSTSDSDETFVYESNPPDAQRRQRHHSRTPSVASSHSIAEQSRSAIRGFGDTYDGRRLGGKRSMKFSSNNAYNDTDSPESQSGTVRSHAPRHFGRFGRNGHNSGNYESESPYPPQGHKGRHNHLTAPHGRSPVSPRSPQTMQYRSGGIFGRKSETPYDFDTEQNADDETAPLLSNTRSPRGHRNPARQISRNLPSSEYLPQARRRGCNPRTSACVCTTIFVLLILSAAVGFVFSSSRALYDVDIQTISHVLASEQELLLDVLVTAVNPNSLAVTVSDVDLDIFARSKHFGPGSDGSVIQERLVYSSRRDRNRRRSSSSPSGDSLSDSTTSSAALSASLPPSSSNDDHGLPNPNPSQDSSGHWLTPLQPDTTPGHDHGTSPDPPPTSERQTLFLGRTFRLDQNLVFPPSPLGHDRSHSSATLRVSHPGNKTETDGSEKWDRVVLFPFELIVKGILKYDLPVTGRTQHVSVGGSLMVRPAGGEVDDD